MNHTYTHIEKDIRDAGFTIVETDFAKPWGGYIRIDNSQANHFIEKYFSGIELPPSTNDATLSPKILIVEKEKKLSWQVHERRAEFWRVVTGPVGVYLSPSDDQPADPEIFQTGDTITVPVGTRHRLAGLDSQSVIAEIWIHTNPLHPSEETDIRRLADDFGR